MLKHRFYKSYGLQIRFLVLFIPQVIIIGGINKEHRSSFYNHIVIDTYSELSYITENYFSVFPCGGRREKFHLFNVHILSFEKCW